jgi:putative phosphoribosyl transferase
MQQTIMETQLQDREQAGVLLSKKLAMYNNTDAVVVGIPHGGVCVAAAIANMLSLKLEVIPCRKIKHPGDNRKNIGSIGVDEVFIHDCPYTIPQDYIAHQIALLRSAIAFENKNYYGKAKPGSFRNKVVILVDDVLWSSDTIMACLRGIKKQSPLKIIVAVPVVDAEAARVIRAEADDLYFLKMENTIGSPSDHFIHFPKIDESKVIELFKSSKKKSRILEVAEYPKEEE